MCHILAPKSLIFARFFPWKHFGSKKVQKEAKISGHLETKKSVLFNTDKDADRLQGRHFFLLDFSCLLKSATNTPA
jgi:hypothetical protein